MTRGRRIATALAFAAASASLLTTANCGPSEECLRLSDCDEGFTCSAGRCRSSEELASGSIDVDAGEGGSSTDAKPSDGSSTARDSSSDARTDAEGGSDAAPTDAPTG